MKRSYVTVLLSALMVFALAFSMAACGGGGGAPAGGATSAAATTAATTTTAASAAPAANITLNYWSFPLWQGATGTEMDDKYDAWHLAMIDEFKKGNPEIKEINFELLAWDTGVQKLDVAVASNDAPNTCYIDLAWLPKYVKQDMALPVNDYLKPGEKEDIYESASDYATYGGKLYAYPILIAPRLFYANKTMLDEMGLADKLPLTGARSWTTDEFLEIANNFPIEKNGKKIFAAAIGTGQSSWDQYLWFWNFGAELYDVDESKFTLGSPAGIAAVKFLKDLVDRDIFKLVSGGATYPNFWGGELAFGISMGYTLEQVVDQATKSTPEGDPVPEFVAMQFPRGPGVEHAYTYSGIGGLPVFKQKTHDENQVKAAMNFASFLTSGEKNGIVKTLGCFPVRRSTGDVYGGDPNAAICVAMLPYGRDLGRSENTNKVFLNVINPYLDEIYQGAKTVEQGLKDMTEEAEKILKQ